ncbi:MAG: molybdopterin-dependent oxidoreductase, partial [Dehalococcoidia bacterium]|nr:molybdopterin-dependent oxidoreductase [Dehalococcoidia bacterium]
IPQVATIEEVNPFIERDMSKCVLCAKCIRADHEIVVQGAIDYIGRGFVSRPATLHDMPLEKSECTFCGTCVAICPTGALMEKKRPYGGTAPRSVSTTCALCGCGCSMNLEIKDNRIIRARPGTESPVNRRTLCVKGSYGYDFVHSPERLTEPLIRAGDTFEAVSWEKALEKVSSGLSRIMEAHGGDSIGFLGSPKCTNEENYLFQRFARTVAGTNNIDSSCRLYGVAGVVGLGSAIGFPGSTNPIDALEHAEVIMIAGANPASSAPAIGYAVKRALRQKGARLILIDPQQTELSSYASVWLRPGIGTDLALLNGMAQVIIGENLMDEEFVSRRTDNYETLRKELAPVTPAYVEQVTGVPAGDIRRAARLFAEADSSAIVFGDGITQQSMATYTVMALANLAMLTGNIGLRGGIFQVQRECNSQGACDMGVLPDLLPGYECVGEDQSRKKFEQVWGAPVPSRSGLTALEMIEKAAFGGLKCLYIMREDPLGDFPGRDVVRKALESVDLLVVHELFMTDTARMAHVVLPSASFAEKDGTCTNFEGRVQVLRKAIEPAGSSRPEADTLLALAETMGRRMPYASLEQVQAEMQNLVPLYHVPSRKDRDTRDIYRTKLDRDPLKNRRLFRGQFPSGFGRFSHTPYEPRPEISRDGYPFTLLTGSIPFHSGTGADSSKSRRLREFVSEAYVEIGALDAGRFGINQGDVVRISSPSGEVSVPARISKGLPQGTFFMPFCFPSTPFNQLFGAVPDTRAESPAFKACAVNLERTLHA